MGRNYATRREQWRIVNVKTTVETFLGGDGLSPLFSGRIESYRHTLTHTLFSEALFFIFSLVVFLGICEGTELFLAFFLMNILWTGWQKEGTQQSPICLL